ncbi:MAG: UTP--glucose-1-phosphate uridylyltransferase GalU [Kiloniellaceae bacterium]
MARRPRTAIFPVGGLGTRFLPATKAMPKEMLPVVDKPLIHYAVEEARDSGIEQFIFVTGRGKSAIEDHFDHSCELSDVLGTRGKHAELEAVESMLLEPGQVAYIRQQVPLGLGHAVWCARRVVPDEPVAVLLADDLVLAETPCLKQMIEAYAAVGGNMAAVMDVPRAETQRYGVLDVIAEDGDLVRAKGLVEKPKPEDAPSTLSIIGRYILDPRVFAELDRREAGAGGEIQLTDAMARTIDRMPFHGLRFAGRRFDCGSKAGFLEAGVAFALERSDLRGDMADILERYGADTAT